MHNAAARWRDDAACQTADPELFFPISGRGLSLLQVTRAKAVCGRCSVRKECLDYALDTHQQYGVWGGRTEDERRVTVRSAAPQLRRAG